MATNFVAAVKEHMERLATMQAAPPPQNTEEIVQAAVDTISPFIVATIKQNNVELARVLRNNPSLLQAR